MVFYLSQHFKILRCVLHITTREIEVTITLDKKHPAYLHRERKFVESDSLDRNPHSLDAVGV